MGEEGGYCPLFQASGRSSETKYPRPDYDPLLSHFPLPRHGVITIPVLSRHQMGGCQISFRAPNDMRGPLLLVFIGPAILVLVFGAMVKAKLGCDGSVPATHVKTDARRRDYTEYEQRMRGAWGTRTRRRTGRCHPV